MPSVEKENLARVEQLIRDFWASAPTNSLHLKEGEKAWAEPHVGIARGEDPFFTQLKERIGPFYWTPEEAFELGFPDEEAKATELRVISYVLPQTEQTRADQGQQNEMPAERWARSRFYGEQFNCDLRLHLAERLTQAGFQTVAPERLSGFDYRRSPRYGIASNWSERHTAFIAGLGTFGLSDGLITHWGKAVRFGSVVTRMELPVTARPYGDDHQAWCLWYARGVCGACVRRCPDNAITTVHGHDKDRCAKYIRDVAAPYATEKFGTGATPCGLCQVKIPCESQVPQALLDQP